MFALTESSRYYLYSKSTDMRKGFNGLSTIVESHMSKNILSGDVFVFVNKNRSLMKLLKWESGGLVLYYKRLESGTFCLPDPKDQKSVQISWSDLILIVEGIHFDKFKRQKRYSIPK